MAPSRRKSVSKAAAAAAARRKWKFGDLVFAKVKGFPAWPATVSEAGKWGYPADQKKIVVQFFGCEQIAFCNPVDIEEFTEEKKVSLLGKRHGKGADFVRAVNEIIDCFDKLKKQERISGAIRTEEIDVINENNSQESTVASWKDAKYEVKVDQLSTRKTNDLGSLTAYTVENADMRNSVFNEIPPFTRNNTDVIQSRNSSAAKEKPASRLSRSSKIDSRLRSASMLSVNTIRTSRRLCASASDDRSLRRRRIVKPSDDSDGQNIAFIVNDRSEESNSELMSVNSDTVSFDNGSTVDSVCKPLGARDPSAENNEGETELSDRLGFRSNNVVKKKRNPNRKRHNTSRVDEGKLNIGASEIKTVHASSGFSEKPTQKSATDDGDEHLPLVKRARVRMGKPSLTAEEDFPSLQKEERMCEVPERKSVESFEPFSCKVKDDANKGSVLVMDETTLSSISHVSPNRTRFLETRKNSFDGEAALPPSKRLHRALQAMSANVAEDRQRTSCCSPAADNVQSSGYCASSSSKGYEMSVGKRDMTEIRSGALDDLRSSLLSTPTPCIVSDDGVLEITPETNVVEPECCKGNTTNIKNLELCTSCFEQGNDTKGPKIFPFVVDPLEIDIDPIVDVHVKMETENVVEQLTNFNCNASSAVISPTHHCMKGCTELKEPAEESDPDILPIQANCTSMQDIAVGLPNIETYNQADYEGDEVHKTKDLPAVEHKRDNTTSERVEEARLSPLNLIIMHPVTPVQILNSGHGQSLVHSTSISYEHMEDRTVSGNQSSSSLTDGPGSVVRTSPPHSSTCNLSALDTKKPLIINSPCCPDIHLRLEKAKFAGKFSSQSEALSSFEAIVKSLTRIKESIGRATRIAIDCAKSGFATKVVEILAHNLESESSLHKKVDLFFLVDSITQCSRSIKGDGGVYPSAIQAILPRLLLAAAPPGSSSRENHRQCLKVLKVWQERKILPEPIICHHIRELDTLCCSYPTMGSNRASRNERAFDDPVREMEGMLVDEYGSNSSIQLPGFCMPRIVGVGDDDPGSDSDCGSFEAVTPEHIVDNHKGDKNVIHAFQKHRRILEDVDGELEMEDVAPFCEVEIASSSDFGGLDREKMGHHQPMDVPLTSADVSRSLLPPPPPPSPPPPPPHSASNGSDSKAYSRSENYNGKVRENKNYEAEVPKHMQGDSCFRDRPTSRLSDRASVSEQPNGGFGKSFHLRPPHPAPSNQFSYVQEQWKDSPAPSRPNRFHSRNSDNGNFYRDRDRNRFVHRDNLGEGWRPPSISGPYYPDSSRMANAPISYGGPPREPYNRWNYPSRPMNHRHFNPYRQPSESPIHVDNRGPYYWKPR